MVPDPRLRVATDNPVASEIGTRMEYTAADAHAITNVYLDAVRVMLIYTYKVTEAVY